MNATLASVLAELQQCAARPLDRAKCMPGELYFSEDVLQLERERIFATDWTCVGRADQIKSAGDYLTYNVAGVPTYSINTGQAGIRTFQNVCTHRGTVLLEGSGNTKQIVCPYHAWCFDAFGGQLRGAPHMQNSAEFDKKGAGLRELRTELWQGWIYVTLDEAQPAVAGRLAGLQQLIANYGMESYELLHVEDMVWDCNWKCLVDNFLDEYHPYWLHRQTFGEIVGNLITQMVPKPGDYDAWTVHYVPLPESLIKNAKRLVPTLDHWQVRHDMLMGIYPTQLVNIMPGGPMFWLLLQPQGTSQVKIRYGLSAPPGMFDLAEETPTEVKALYERVNMEDKSIVERVFRGVSAPGVQLGALSHLEWSTWEFQKYLSRRLGAVQLSAPEA